MRRVLDPTEERESVRIERTGNKLEKYTVTEAETGGGGKVMNEERNIEVRRKVEKGNPEVNGPKKKKSRREIKFKTHETKNNMNNKQELIRTRGDEKAERRLHTNTSSVFQPVLYFGPFSFIHLEFSSVDFVLVFFPPPCTSSSPPPPQVICEKIFRPWFSPTLLGAKAGLPLQVILLVYSCTLSVILMVFVR